MRGAFTAAQPGGPARRDGAPGGDARAHHAQAKLKADEEARKAAEAQARVASGENGDNGEDKKEESSSDDEEPEARRRLERRGRGLGRADAAQRWRDLEAKADALCQRADDGPSDWRDLEAWPINYGVDATSAAKARSPVREPRRTATASFHAGKPSPVEEALERRPRNLRMTTTILYLSLKMIKGRH